MVGSVITPDGQGEFRDEQAGPAEEAEMIGERLAEKLLASGADKILA